MLAVLLVEFVVVFEVVRFGLCEGCAYGCRGCVMFVFFFVAVVLIVFLALLVEVCGGGGL